MHPDAEGQTDDESRLHSFEVFFQRRQRELSRLAFLMIGEAGEADDIAADALVAAWKNWDRVRASDYPVAYVRRMVVNIAASRVRTRVRDHKRHLILAAERDDETQPVDSEVTLDVRAALAMIPPGRRACIVLRYAFDLSEEEVARTLQISPGTVKSQTSKAAAQLRDVLRDLGPETWAGDR